MYGKTGPPYGPPCGGGNNFLGDTKKGVGAKNSRAVVASYPALTFSLKKAQFPKYCYLIPLEVLNKFADLPAARK